MKIPSTIRAADTIQWVDVASKDSLGNAITSSEYGLTYFLRFNSAGEGATVVGTANGNGWDFTISAATSAGFDAGPWYWQAIATKGSISHTLGAGQLTVQAALNYSGSNPAAFDGRTQSQKDLAAVSEALRNLISGGAVKRYTIGNRQLEKFTLAELREYESILKARVSRELAAESVANGLGNPNSYFVRFSR
jgi:hypothetical protein